MNELLGGLRHDTFGYPTNGLHIHDKNSEINSSRSPPNFSVKDLHILNYDERTADWLLNLDISVGPGCTITNPLFIIR